MLLGAAAVVCVVCNAAGGVVPAASAGVCAGAAVAGAPVVVVVSKNVAGASVVVCTVVNKVDEATGVGPRVVSATLASPAVHAAY